MPGRSSRSESTNPPDSASGMPSFVTGPGPKRVFADAVTIRRDRTVRPQLESTPGLLFRTAKVAPPVDVRAPQDALAVQKFQTQFRVIQSDRLSGYRQYNPRQRHQRRTRTDKRGLPDPVGHSDVGCVTSSQGRGTGTGAARARLTTVETSKQRASISSTEGKDVSPLAEFKCEPKAGELISKSELVASVAM